MARNEDINNSLVWTQQLQQRNGWRVRWSWNN